MPKKKHPAREKALLREDVNEIARENYLPISDEQLDDFKKRVNDIIHELVFAVQHMDQGDIEETQNGFITAHFSLDSVAEDYEKLRKAKFPNS